MLAVGAAVAGVVLLGGLLWPTQGEDSSATAASGVRGGQPDAGSTMPPAPGDHEQASADAAEEAEMQTETTESTGGQDVVDAPPAGAGDAPSSQKGDVEQAAAGLLRVIAGCGADGDSRCAAAIADGAAEFVLERLRGSDAARRITPVEDYGDIAVVRLAASGERGEQMLVMAREKDRWLVRDVYDVADQPSDAG